MKVGKHENAHCTFGGVLVYGDSNFREEREID